MINSNLTCSTDIYLYHKCRARDIIFFVCLFLLFMVNQTVFFHYRKWYGLIALVRIIIPIIALLIFKLYAVKGITKQIAYLYLAFLFNMMIISPIMSPDDDSTFLLLGNYAMMLLTFFIFILILHHKNFSLIYVSAPIYIMAFLALIGLIDFFHIRYNTFLYTGLSTTIPPDRLVSIFKEPSLLSMCMLYPLYMSWGIYSTMKLKRFLFLFLFLILCFMYVRSTAGLIGIACPIILHIFLRYSNKDKWKRKILRTFFSFIIGIGAMIGFVYMIIYLSIRRAMHGDFTGIMTLLNFLPSKRLAFQQNRLGDFKSTVEYIIDHPFGIGVMNMNYFDINSVFISPVPWWTITTGWLGGLLIVLIFLILLIKLIIPNISAKELTLTSYSCMSLLSIYIAQVSYGRWMDTNILYVTAICLTLNRYRL
ncbi:membrane protein [Candidatus Magnetoovum chiemensis]|nr:membrane protein [Candidatus Magnetoovum chiemensis]